MSFNPSLNFYSSRSSTTPSRGGQVQDPLAPLERKLDSIFNMLTQQNQQMVALQDQGGETLEQLGTLRRGDP